MTSAQEVAATAQDVPSSQSDLYTPVAAPPESMGHMFTPKVGEAMADGEDSTIDSPAFDESFAMDAQLVLGGLITPATALRPEAAQHSGKDPQVIPLYNLSHDSQTCGVHEELHIFSCDTCKDNVMLYGKGYVHDCTIISGVFKSSTPIILQETLDFGSSFAPSTRGQRAYEMVEEAAAEAGLLSTDSQRLVNVRMQTLKPVLLMPMLWSGIHEKASVFFYPAVRDMIQ